MKREVVEGDVFGLLPRLEDESAHAAVVDYPWKFNGDNGTGRFQSTNDSRKFEAYHTEDHRRLPDVLDLLAENWFRGRGCSSLLTTTRFPSSGTRSKTPYSRTAAPSSGTARSSGWASYHRVQHYPFLTATNGDTERYIKRRGTVYRAERNDFTAVYNDDAYPTSKPTKLYRQMLAPPVLEDGETLLEPFCGSGPGAAVAAGRGLGYWGGDLNPEAVTRTRDELNQRRLM